jgi:N4-gp56 family major capsid protein
MPSSMNTVVASGALGNAETGVLISNSVRQVYSKEILFKAMPVMKFYQFATIKTELGVEPGLTINMLTFNNLTLGGTLTEGTRMTTQALSSQMTTITVAEQGNAISVTELALKSAFHDTLTTGSALLGRDMALVLDVQLRNTAYQGTNVVYARTSRNVQPATQGTMDSTSSMKVSVIKDAVEVLATNNAPKFDGDYFICFVHPHQSRTLRDDPAWINASRYGAPVQLFNGEIGRIDDVRFIETTLMSNGNAATSDPSYDVTLHSYALGDGTTGNLYKSVIFGEMYFGFAVSLPVELRDNGVVDFGREHGLAWYAIWGTGVLHNEYGVVVYTV